MPKPDVNSRRCPWPGEDPLYMAYHDREWGVHEHDHQRLFEKLVLDGFQAGLSWITILKKRDHFRKAFHGFDPYLIARWGDRQRRALLANAGIVRNRAKVDSAFTNARAWIKVMQDSGDFDGFIWEVTEGRTIQNQWRRMSDVPAETVESRALSKKLRSAGFKFVGPTIVYAFMQAVGMVNDHLVDCFRHAQLKRRR